MQDAKDIYLSPLRYPGGKGCLSSFFTELIEANQIKKTYCEVYAGGAGAALNLLFAQKIKQIILNDADYHIYAFWKALLEDGAKFIQAIDTCKLSITEWKKQREIYENPNEFSLFKVGFSTFFLNRCNRGGILPKAGPIGGLEQTGNYLIDARFNKVKLIRRMKNIIEQKRSISIYNLDAIDFLNKKISKLDPTQTLIYLDPPYYNQGRNLYLNFYNESDHSMIRDVISKFPIYKWIISYENIPEIKELYNRYRQFSFDLNYSVQVSRKGSELMIFSNSLKLPTYFTVGKKSQKLSCI